MAEEHNPEDYFNNITRSTEQLSEMINIIAQTKNYFDSEIAKVEDNNVSELLGTCKQYVVNHCGSVASVIGDIGMDLSCLAAFQASRIDNLTLRINSMSSRMIAHEHKIATNYSREITYLRRYIPRCLKLQRIQNPILPPNVTKDSTWQHTDIDLNALAASTFDDDDFFNQIPTRDHSYSVAPTLQKFDVNPRQTTNTWKADVAINTNVTSTPQKTSSSSYTTSMMMAPPTPSAAPMMMAPPATVPAPTGVPPSQHNETPSQSFSAPPAPSQSFSAPPPPMAPSQSFSAPPPPMAPSQSFSAPPPPMAPSQSFSAPPPPMAPSQSFSAPPPPMAPSQSFSAPPPPMTPSQSFSAPPPPMAPSQSFSAPPPPKQEVMPPETPRSRLPPPPRAAAAAAAPPPPQTPPSSGAFNVYEAPAPPSAPPSGLFNAYQAPEPSAPQPPAPQPEPYYDNYQEQQQQWQEPAAEPAQEGQVEGYYDDAGNWWYLDYDGTYKMWIPED